MRGGRPVTAGLSQVARMGQRERARTVRELCRNQPAFRSMLTRVSVARGVAFASGLVLAVAIVLLMQGVPSGWVSLLVLVGLAGFVSVVVVLADSRFDLLLAVIGAHRIDELHDRLVIDEVYGDGAVSAPASDESAGSGARSAGAAVNSPTSVNSRAGRDGKPRQ